MCDRSRLYVVSVHCYAGKPSQLWVAAMGHLSCLALLTSWCGRQKMDKHYQGGCGDTHLVCRLKTCKYYYFLIITIVIIYNGPPRWFWRFVGGVLMQLLWRETPTWFGSIQIRHPVTHNYPLWLRCCFSTASLLWQQTTPPCVIEC